MSASTCILVMGTGRSGTSLTAGVLHRLGVYMGDRFVTPDRNNPRGTYEDRDLFELNTRVIDGQEVDPCGSYRTWVERRSVARIWGAKDPRLQSVWRFVASHLPEDTRIVIVRRAAEASIASYAAAYGASPEQAQAWHARRLADLESVERQWIGPVMTLQLLDLVCTPSEAITELIRFAFAKTWFLPTVEHAKSALAFVDPALVTHGV